MRKSIVLSLVLLFGSMSVNAFEWTNILDVLTPNTSASSENTEQKLETPSNLINIQNQVKEIDNSVQEEFMNIVSLLSSKKEVKSIQSQMSSIQTKKLSETEKAELMNNVLLTYATDLITGQNTKKTFKNLSVADKIELTKQMTLLEQNAQKYAVLAKQTIASSAMNVISSKNTTTTDEFTNIIKQTNETATLIKEKAVSTMFFVNQIRAIAQQSGVTQ